MEMLHGEGGVTFNVSHLIVIAERWIVKHVHRVNSSADFNLGVDQLLPQAWFHRSLFHGSTFFLKPAVAGQPRRAR
jgi:hypothetical protein